MDIASILLAAGASQRFGPANKLVARVGGEPIIARVARVLDGSRVDQVIVVTPPEDHPDTRQIAEALAARDRQSSKVAFRLVANPDRTRGMGSSIAAGVRALGAEYSGVLIVPGDMPALTPAVVDRLIAAFSAAHGDAIVHAATRDGRQRNPVIWPRRLFPALAVLDGEAGGKPLIAAERAAQAGSVIAVPFDDDRLFCDIDTVADLEGWL